MNLVLIITDSQTKSMVGAYGNPEADTPNLDRMAAQGIRFERAYTSTPVCTPARGAIFTGMQPAVNGAWSNNLSPHRHIPLMGTIFRRYGYRAAYTGKWHLDGSEYFGDGEPDGGFEPDWWFDGYRYAHAIGPEMFARYKTAKTAQELRQAGFTEEKIWGHMVADRAVDFLESVGEDEPFLLVVSFDEPHGPFIAPPEYWERFEDAEIPEPPNYNAPVTDKPAMQQIQRRQNGDVPWIDRAAWIDRFYGCNAYIDREIGRVLDAVETLHAEDTAVIYTSDHGDMLGAHGLISKGPMMYEEITSIPFIVRIPGGPEGAVSNALISQIDLMPTLLELAGIEPPESLHGQSLAPLFRTPEAAVHEHVFISFNRFAINHDQFGAFYPIRCVRDERYKLAINLIDSDELYDLVEDPYETHNLIDDPAHAQVRNRLHKRLIDEMERIRDPFRAFAWENRPWQQLREPFYWGGENRKPPQGFPFEPKPLSAPYAD
ncbi:MAG: sulfatase-like hydrolase/transferase [Caldilineaceae bacterium]|nr:sulfatase-like hydrolase/transferase [Caldilineaceae bacterium]